MKGLMELSSKYEALLMTVITQNGHLRGQGGLPKGSFSRSFSSPSWPISAQSTSMSTRHCRSR